MADMTEMVEKIHPAEEISATNDVETSSNLFQKLKRQLTFTLKRGSSAFFDDRQESFDSNCSSEGVEERILSQKGHEARSNFRKGRSEEIHGGYHSPLERCILSRERRLRRKMSVDNFSLHLNKTT